MTMNMFYLSIHNIHRWFTIVIKPVVSTSHKQYFSELQIWNMIEGEAMESLIIIHVHVYTMERQMRQNYCLSVANTEGDFSNFTSDFIINLRIDSVIDFIINSVIEFVIDSEISKHVHITWLSADCFVGVLCMLASRGGWSHYWIIIERTFLMTSVRIALLVRKLWSADSAGWTGLKRPCIAWLAQCRAYDNMTNLLWLASMCNVHACTQDTSSTSVNRSQNRSQIRLQNRLRNRILRSIIKLIAKSAFDWKIAFSVSSGEAIILSHLAFYSIPVMTCCHVTGPCVNIACEPGL